jgi:RNA polymerase sigma factor (TIGR02999 family)
MIDNHFANLELVVMPDLTTAPETETQSLTVCLRALHAGQPGAEERLLGIVYGRLRQMAGYRMRHERPDHTLQPTALANEVVLRLIRAARNVEWKDSAHFYASCAQTMRHILIDHARKNKNLKGKVELFPGVALSRQKSEELLAMDISLTRLAQTDPRGAQVIEMTVFLGLTQSEAAEALGVAERTVKRDYVACLAFLRNDLKNKPAVNAAPA